ncbi:hypothetical protein COW36_11535 [bacterium (Candidatus Blackallbacteria) CG17_big_fil_post_rev_8_21_14_2_50_48_46]|uniref:TonB-dependent receptor-like beta-barrel domain-containing protein n=1 Tax=bacterium (Candidatus Blackallbacteria) CG17_big_fil_post_rev_8_21_14_2_50_48_46 TaxID=2014261 RepID=A0A2M7G4G5_9BACT|nr:MAG: hypothetical protein COW64_21755 [bacterium (Candidatus Blackallbacteria) CG18_big_fil_WC_8_21_14_2_50_49_26]PIW16769.1 MAG: hypothetical protein COW36_11535 [bacterium (Candidatus Blackallbacteria) CG17_big_fil_post_rev_8_21_14_2_50_48_46]PIW49561.1 MAG: hypothetical protein COW20_05455 [bacterium (Candidatus Blackallbacteria) CG13_big_fil_rev_8_21_14_2_50_49_14]
MWNKLSLTVLALLLSLPATAAELPPNPAVTETSMEQGVSIEGLVQDAASGKPLENVYIKQEDSLNAAFSQAGGKFSLRLMRGFPSVLVFSREGYESVALPFQNSSQNLRINLQPLKNYQPSLAPAHSQPEATDNLHIFGDQFTLFYQMNYSMLFEQNVGIQGAAMNEMGLDTDLLLFYPLAIRGRFYRGRLPVNVANFPFQPAFFVNTLQAKIGTGWIQDLNPNLQIYLGGDLLFHNQSPDNRSSQDQTPVPFTGSVLDFEQNRVSLGARASLAWKINDRLTLFPDLSIYPVGLNFVRNRPGSSPVDFLLAGDLGLKGRFEIMPGIYAIANYNTQLWYGAGANYLNNVHFFHLGVSVDPWTVAAKLQ